MTFTQRLSAVGVMALSLTACLGSGVKPPDVKLNPAPKERYEIMLTIDDPPEPIQKVMGSIQYNIKDTSCMPTADRIAGVQPKSSHERSVDFKRTADNTFVGYIHADALSDEDYYGRGVCRWGVTGVIVRIPTGRTNQAAVIRGAQIIGEGVRIGACLREAAISDICIYPLGGVEGEDLERNFVATIRARKASP